MHLYVIKGFLSSLPVLCEDGGGLVKKPKLLVRGQNVPTKSHNGSLTIIPRARMGSESIAHEGERNNCFSKIQLVGQKYRDKTT